VIIELEFDKPIDRQERLNGGEDHRAAVREHAWRMPDRARIPSARPPASQSGSKGKFEND